MARKILIFHHGNRAIGAGLCLVHITKSLVEQGNRVCAVVPAGGDISEALESVGTEVYHEPERSIPHSYCHYSGSAIGFFNICHAKNIVALYRDAKYVSTIIDRMAPDIVMVNSMTLFWIGRIAKKKGIPAICFSRETYKKGNIGLRSEVIKRGLREWFEAAIYISNYDLEETGKSKHIAVRITDKVDMRLYKEGKKEEMREKLRLPKGEKLILFTGGCSWFKGGLTAIKAMPLIEDRNTKMIILQYQPKNHPKNHGNDYQDLMEKQIKEDGLEERMILRPATDHVEEYFLAADMVVFPSTQAHQARPIYEAGAARIPLFISDFPNTREFADERNAYLFKVNDHADLAKRINECMSDKIGRERRVIHNAEKTGENHDLRTLGSEIEDVLKML